MLERAVEQYLLRALRKRDVRAIVKKIGGPGWRGWPDRMVLFNDGRVHWVELKRPKGGKFEPLQRKIHEKLRQMGFVVYVLSTKEAVDEYIEDLFAAWAAE